MFRSLLITIAFTACVSATPTPDTKCNTRTFQLKSGATLDGCKTQCEATANCAAYAFRAADGYCMNCALDSAEAGQGGFDMHYMPIPTTTKSDTKCNTRTFQEKSGATLDGCKTQCEATANCAAYAFRATDGYCMNCALDSAEAEQGGFDMHYMPITHSTPTPDTKCNGAERIFSVSSGMTRDTCKTQCQNTANCKAYAFSGTGYCMGCDGIGTRSLDSTQGGFDMHELIFPSMPCSVTCTITSGMISTQHVTTSGHAFHRCYHDSDVSATDCTCECSNTAF